VRFLTAQWRNLVMLNYQLDPRALAARVPAGCELDACAGRTYVSVVGFQFLDTRVRGVAIPFHRNFEEVNLRFYVRRKLDGQWRRGVVFVKELVPRWATATVARWVYGENYIALPMRHSVELAVNAGGSSASYQWRRGGGWEGLTARFAGEPKLAAEDSEHSFITEHYWGYAGGAGRASLEYQVEHPRWRVWEASWAELRCDVGSLYGAEFADALAGRPSTAFVVEGSAVTVSHGLPLI
jgi:uncharacterized protein YqjF (DUF2071 family)